MEPKELCSYIFLCIKYIIFQFAILTSLSVLETGLSISKLSLLSVLFLFSLIKFMTQRNHLLNYLILIEVYIILAYFRFIYLSNNFRSCLVRIFFFMVIIVCGATLGISLLVIITRSINKELELTHSIFTLK